MVVEVVGLALLEQSDELGQLVGEVVGDRQPVDRVFGASAYDCEQIFHSDYALIGKLIDQALRCVLEQLSFCNINMYSIIFR